MRVGGYIIANPMRWAKKKQCTLTEAEEIAKLANRSAMYGGFADWTMRAACRKFGYDHEQLQSFSQWKSAFIDKLQEPNQWSARRSICRLNRLTSLRSGLALVTLYLFAQQRAVILNVEVQNPWDGAPCAILHGMDRDLDNSLLRAFGFLCGHGDTGRKRAQGAMAACTRYLIRRVFGSAPAISRNMFLEWARAAEWGMGIAVPRSIDVLTKIFVETRTPPWKDIEHQAVGYFRTALEP